MSSPIDDELSRFHFSTMVNFHFDLDEPTTQAWVNQENKRLYLSRKLMKIHQSEIIKFLEDCICQYIQKNGTYPAKLGTYDVVGSTYWDSESEKGKIEEQ